MVFVFISLIPILYKPIVEESLIKAISIDNRLWFCFTILLNSCYNLPFHKKRLFIVYMLFKHTYYAYPWICLKKPDITLTLLKQNFIADVDGWSMLLGITLSNWCYSVFNVRLRIHPRGEQTNCRNERKYYKTVQ